MSAPPVKFLLVDDLEANLLALEGLLRREGLELLYARSGREALELLLVHEVALAFIDVQMPEMNGFELAELMRGAERTRSVPIIFVTAGATDNQRRFRGYELGAVDFLFKPLDPHVLRSKASVFFDLARQRDELRRIAAENARLLKESTDSEQSLRKAQETINAYAGSLEKAVAERTAKLRETMHELEAFSYSIAHDMRSPLRTMVGFSEFLLDDYADKLDAQGRRHLERIASSAKRLDQLIQDVLSYSRIVREDLPLGTVDARKLVDELIDSYPNLREAKECVDVAPEIPPVKANTAALTQVLSNLLSNSVKFVPENTRPAVRVWGERVEIPRPGIEEPGKWVRLWVEDNGIGIDPSAQPRLFEMFQRFTSPGLYEGTGMGLAIARKATARMGGQIGMDPTYKQGCRFWVLLPAADPAHNDPAPNDRGRDGSHVGRMFPGK